jgi:microsomal dipeptidase-like Zn-dependent dipeptidase
MTPNTHSFIPLFILAGACSSSPADLEAVGTQKQALDVPVMGLFDASADFDGDGKTDRVLWQPGSGLWSGVQSSAGALSRAWGAQSAGDIPVPADYDGDGKTDLAVWRRPTGQWFMIKSTTGKSLGPAFGSAALGDIPVPGDYDGDMKADLAVLRTSTNTWRLQQSTAGLKEVVFFDFAEGDIAVPRDYDGDGKTDVARFRAANGEWLIRFADGTERRKAWGTSGDIPVPGDYDGDRQADLAVFRPATNQWSVLPSSNIQPYGSAWGNAAAGDIPLAGADFDGDRKADLAVWNPTTAAWSIRTSDGQTIAATTPQGSIAAKHHAMLSLNTATGSAPPAKPKLPGFADLHLLMMAEEAFGGGWTHGKYDGLGATHDCDGGLPPSDHARVKQDLSGLLAACPSSAVLNAASGGLLGALFSVGGIGGSEEIATVEGTKGDTGLHLTRAKYGEGWPRWDTIAHHQAAAKDLKRAYLNGESVVVLNGYSYEWLCKLIPEQNRKRACDEMVDVKAQLSLVKTFAAQNADWVEIALSPADTRRIVGAKKLAVVLGIETTHIMGRDVNGANLVERLDELYNLGVRSMQLVHMQDNPFGGAAPQNPIFQIAQYTENCFVDPDDYGCGLTGGGLTLGFDVDQNCRNVRGLSALGKTLVREMIKRKMLINAAHLSERSVQDLFEIAKAEQYYPFYISHGHFREVMNEKLASYEKTTPASIIRLLRQTGGIFGLRTAHDETRTYSKSVVPNTCQGSSQSFAQAYEYGRKGLKVNIAFGSDFNGFIQQTRPRFGELGACSAGSRGEAQCQERDQRESGAPRLGTDFDEKGLAHVGLLPDLMQDLENQGLDLSNLESSSENFVRMWERTEEARSGAADTATDIDTTGIVVGPNARQREATYPQACALLGGLSYCDGALALGYECRTDAECSSHRCTAVACGTVPGTCVCDQDYDCPTGNWCDRNLPVTGRDNSCRPGKGDHDTCVRDSMCASGHCGGIIANGLGWCYTPNSKSYDEGCRANAECKSNRCGDLTQLCKCKTNGDCPSGKFCGDLLNDGQCIAKRSDHSACTSDSQCASDKCGGVGASSGWCYTPNSRNIGQGCRADAECTTNRCVDTKLICGCTSNAQCGSNAFCGSALNAGECVAKRSKGAACLHDYECSSNRCADVGHYCRNP